MSINDLESDSVRPANDGGVLRIVLADDHAVVREGLKALINGQSDMRVVAEVGDGQAAVDAANAFKPDVLIMDLSMPILPGDEATLRVHAECPTVKVLALTVHEERQYLLRLLRAGASGYVLKRSAPSELIRAVRAVAGGAIYLDPLVAGTVVESYLEAAQAVSQRPPATLSGREYEVLIRIAKGYSNKEIAAALSLSVKTVETYKARVAEKLGVRSRVDIVSYAISQGWLESPERE